MFTGSSTAAKHITNMVDGKVRLEDAGFDWKILGPDGDNFTDMEIDYVAHVIDQDCFALAGQKCSAQSIMFAHETFVKRGLYNKMSD